ncbi:hypothetical protein [Deinococcus misasensis]|uniref:hypothetical protein n=1 Tax=Deinococcus misasensis TaxID=392413 RepID=UPI000555E2A8|nr:hypothetical protein [Deinococcus misasensis]
MADILDASKILEVGIRAINAAREHFGLASEWRIFANVGEVPEGCRAAVQMHSDYLNAYVTFHPFYEDPEQVWGDAGHEVAHLLLAELEPVRAHIEQDEKHGRYSPLDRMFRFGVERTVSRLEAQWKRMNPYPGEPEETPPES